MRGGTASSLVIVIAVLLGICVTTGCGNSDATFPVRGQVVYPDGSTLPLGGQVIFTSVNVDPAVTAKGYFESDGQFELTKFSNGNGAVAGEYEVAVLPLVPDDRGNMSQAQYIKAMSPIADWFKSPKTSGLRFTVSAETAPHEFRLEVRRPRRR